MSPSSGAGGGDRLYTALAFFDTRDGSFEADLVRAAREGYERSQPEMNEPDAWVEFDRLLDRHREAMGPSNNLDLRESRRDPGLAKAPKGPFFAADAPGGQE